MELNELKKELERVESALFYEQMADFMNWDNYYRLRARERELKEKLKEMEG